MTVNRYMLQTKDGNGYAPSNRRHINRLIEHEQAEWVGSDPDGDDVIHYADRIKG